MSKQTAVEWLVAQVEDFHCLLPVDMINQALAMEREQIVEGFDIGIDDGMVIGKEDEFAEFADGEYYYEQTYGKEAGNEG